MSSEIVAGAGPALPRAEFRPMRPQDVAIVAAIEQGSYPHPWTEGIFRDCLRVGYECRAIELDGRVIGYGIMSMGAGEAHILNVCVEREFRCRGFGRHMIEFLLARAREAGIAEMFLEVRPSNVAAVRLYQKMGFGQIGVRKGYYPAIAGREDAMMFKLDLTDRIRARTD